jgi:predicted transcriptional regulator
MIEEKPNEHATRKRILRHVGKNRGISFRRIMRDLDLNEGTLRYHLRVLLKEGRVKTSKEGGRRIYYTGAKPPGEVEEGPLKLTRSDERVLSIVGEHPGCTKKDILRSMEISGKELDEVLIKLEHEHRIWRIKEKGRVTFEKVTAEGIKERMLLDLALMYLDGRIDEPTFLRLKERIEHSKSG